ncbi:hypothetical protein QUF76_04295 [Desulfobacterales bacterium HSG16]|nr:hypothetical protein [Desulfobacterales bacterium HSG16]
MSRYINVLSDELNSRYMVDKQNGAFPFEAALETIREHLHQTGKPVRTDTLIPLYIQTADIMAENGFQKTDLSEAVVHISLINSADDMNNAYFAKALGAAFLALFLSDNLLGNGSKDLKIKAFLLNNINIVDDWLVRNGHFQNDWRRLLLESMHLRYQRDNLHYFCRHTDLVIGFKLALYYLEQEDMPFKIIGFDLLKTLPDKIEQRIGVTYNGPGMGDMPSGHSVFKRRCAMQPRDLPDLGKKDIEKFRNLHRLSAQCHYELGRAYTLLPVGSRLENQSHAIECFKRSKNIYLDLNEPDIFLAAFCSVAIMQTVFHRAPLLKDHSESMMEIASLYKMFQDFITMTDPLKTTLDKDKDDADQKLQQLQKLAFSYSFPAVQLITKIHVQKRMTKQEERNDNILNIFKSLLVNARKSQLDNPWASLVHIKMMDDAMAQCVFDKVSNKQQAENPVYTYYKQHAGDILSIALESIKAAQRQVELFPDIPLTKYHTPNDAFQDQAPDIRVPRSQPVNYSTLIYESIRAVFLTSAYSKTPLNFSQWMSLLPWINKFIPGSYTVSQILNIVRLENDELQTAKNANTLTISEAINYAIARIDSLEDHLIQLYLSRSEKNTISSIILKLVTHIRNITDNFQSLDPETALYFFDRQGASVFRANLLLYGRSCLNTWTDLFQKQLMLDEVSRYATVYERLEHYANNDFASTESEIAIMDRAYLEHLLKTENRKIIYRDCEDPGKIVLETGIPPEKWDRINGKIIVKAQVPSHDQAVKLVEEHRRAIIKMIEHKNEIGILTSQTLASVNVDATEVLSYLNHHPDRVCMYVGPFEVGMPISVFYSKENQLLCEHIFPSSEKDMEIHIGFAVFRIGYLYHDIIPKNIDQDQVF